MCETKTEHSGTVTLYASHQFGDGRLYKRKITRNGDRDSVNLNIVQDGIDRNERLTIVRKADEVFVGAKHMSVVLKQGTMIEMIVSGVRLVISRFKDDEVSIQVSALDHATLMAGVKVDLQSLRDTTAGKRLRIE